jgi:hypothetical protein
MLREGRGRRIAKEETRKIILKQFAAFAAQMDKLPPAVRAFASTLD